MHDHRSHVISRSARLLVRLAARNKHVAVQRFPKIPFRLLKDVIVEAALVFHAVASSIGSGALLPGGNMGLPYASAAALGPQPPGAFIFYVCMPLPIPRDSSAVCIGDSCNTCRTAVYVRCLLLVAVSHARESRLAAV